MDADQSIDAVVTWVDGNDREHRQKRQEALANGAVKRKNRLITGADPTRFVDNGELYYCLSSIRRFAPWIRHIYLVTDNQSPEYLNGKLKELLNVTVVDHREIFESYEWVLPTFNTRTIESALWRIPGIASRFVYFNDDFIITRPIQPEEFFRNEKVVLRGRWNRMTRYGKARKRLNELASVAVRRLFGITRSMHLLLQTRSAQLAGFDHRYYRAPHVPHPIYTDTMRDFFESNPETFEHNIRYKFRNTEQISSIFLCNHLEIQQGRAELRGAEDACMLNGELTLPFALNRQLRRISSGDLSFVCLQAMERFSPPRKKRIERLLSHLLEVGVGEPSGVEL